MNSIQIVFFSYLLLGAQLLFGQDVIKYTYDSQNRIKSVLLPNGNTETYYYDKVGNRVNQINVSTSINEQSSLKGDFNLFPNPTDRIFNLNGQLENEDNFEAFLYDNQGKVILKRLIPSTTSIIERFDVQNLANGTYLFVLKSNSGSRSWNIVKF